MKVTLEENNRITLPEEIVEKLKLSKDDEFIVVLENGGIQLIPAITIPKDEAYLFTPFWQKAIRQAQKELAEGDYEVFDNVEDLLKDLNS